MSLIDVSKYDTGESAEVAAFKAKVRTVADKYSKKYGWCSEVNRALGEMGIANHKPIQVKVSFVIGEITIEKVVAVSIESLLGQSEEGQRNAVAEAIPDVEVRLGSQVVQTLDVGPDDIENFELHSDPNVAEDDTTRWWYTSDNGRVLHYLSEYSTHQAVCGAWLSRLTRTKNSPRGGGRRCERCAKDSL